MVVVAGVFRGAGVEEGKGETGVRGTTMTVGF
jgi:hypothetical protein